MCTAVVNTRPSLFIIMYVIIYFITVEIFVKDRRYFVFERVLKQDLRVSKKKNIRPFVSYDRKLVSCLLCVHRRVHFKYKHIMHTITQTQPFTCLEFDRFRMFKIKKKSIFKKVFCLKKFENRHSSKILKKNLLSSYHKFFCLII